MLSGLGAGVLVAEPESEQVLALASALGLVSGLGRVLGYRLRLD
jgi:hypothetical protein